MRAAFKRGATAQAVAGEMPADLREEDPEAAAAMQAARAMASGRDPAEVEADLAGLDVADVQGRRQVRRGVGAFQKGRSAAAAMRIDFPAEEDEEPSVAPVSFRHPERQRSDFYKAAQKAAQKAKEAVVQVPPELMDDKSLPAEERLRRMELREKLQAEGRAAAAPIAVPAEPEEAAPKRVAFGEAKVEGTAEKQELPAGAQQELAELQREHRRNMRRLKERQQKEIEEAERTLGDDCDEEIQRIDDSMDEELRRAQDRLSKLMENELAGATSDAARGVIKERFQEEMQRVKQENEEIREEKKAVVRKTLAARKLRKQKLLDVKHRDEKRLEKTIQLSENTELEKILAEYEMMERRGDMSRAEEMDKQRKTLAEKLKNREVRRRKKEEKEKEFLQREIRDTKQAEKEVLEEKLVSMEKLEKAHLKLECEQHVRVQALTTGQATLSAAERKEIEDRIRAELEQAQKERRVEEERRFEADIHKQAKVKETNLSAKQAAHKQRDIEIQQGEIDKLVARQRQEQAQADVLQKEERAQQLERFKKKREEKRRKREEEKAKQQAALDRQLDEERRREESRIREEQQKIKQKRDAGVQQRLAEAEKKQQKPLSDEDRDAIINRYKQEQRRYETEASEEMRRQREEVKRRLEEKRRKRAEEIKKKQQQEIKEELRRQERELDLMRKREAESPPPALVPTVEITEEAKRQEQQLDKEHRRRLEDLMAKQKREQQQAEAKLKQELDAQHQQRMKDLQDEHTRRQAELRSKVSSRIDAASPAEREQIIKRAQEEGQQLEKLQQAERAQQEADLKAKIEAKRRRRQGEIQAKHLSEMASKRGEMEREKEEFHKAAKVDAEKAKIKEIVTSGQVDEAKAQEAAEAIMYHRHRDEIRRLEQTLKRERDEKLKRTQEEIGRLLETQMEGLKEQQDEELRAIMASDRDAAEKERLRRKLEEDMHDKKLALKRSGDEERAQMEEAVKEDNDLQWVQRRMDLKIRQLAEIEEATSEFGKPEDVLKRKRASHAAKVRQEAEGVRDELETFRKELAKGYEQQRAEAEALKEKARRELKEQQEIERREFEEEMRREEEKMQQEREARKRDWESKRKAFDQKEVEARSEARATGGIDAERRIIAEFESDKQKMEAQLRQEREKAEEQHNRILEAKRKKKLQRMKKEHQGQLEVLETAASPEASPASPTSAVPAEDAKGEWKQAKGADRMERRESKRGVELDVRRRGPTGPVDDWVKTLVDTVHDPLSAKLEVIDKKLNHVCTWIEKQ
eukprot:TRINITY_DN6313_c1_g4_i1.p1 TRINITY_DN6313_c1_g4~~TRINITY_DN6313_c1_g4_i1.p1  ORF type:complete len:1408 (+),score=740.57 TRINITY_DN6313_c1_g4_i1:430-4224(+)